MNRQENRIIVRTESEIGKTQLGSTARPFAVIGKVGSQLFLAVMLLCTTLPASGDIQLQQINQSIVTVRSYSGKKEVDAGVGFVIHSDIYNGFVVTSAHVLVRGETITVSIPGSEAQLVASNLLQDDSLGLAVLKVNGLQVPALIFAGQPVEQGDSVWSVGIRADRGRTVWLSKGSISRSYVVPGVSSQVHMLMHNASLGESGLGSPLLNECGEIVGFSVSSPGDSAGVAYAMQGGSLSAILTQQNLNIKTADSACLSDAALARQSAERATERADEAKVQAEKAMSIANDLAVKLQDVTRKNNDLLQETRDAQERATRAIKDAAAATRQAQAAREEVGRRTREIMTETQAIFRTMQSESLRREQDLSKDLAEQSRKGEKWERLLLAGLILLLVLLIAAVVYLRKRDEHQEVHEVVPGSPRTEMQKANMSEYVLDGEDRDGVRYLLRISADQLEGENGVVIGRNPPDSPYVINHGDVSRQHVRLKLVKDRLFIEDLNTTNGTTINGQSIDQKGSISMNNGDQIIMGSVVLRLRTIN